MEPKYSAWELSWFRYERHCQDTVEAVELGLEVEDYPPMSDFLTDVMTPASLHPTET